MHIPILDETIPTESISERGALESAFQESSPRKSGIWYSRGSEE